MFLQTSKIYMNRTINYSICYFKSYYSKYYFYKSGSHLLSHTVSSIVPSAAYVLTIVFGMGTGVTHKRITTGNFIKLLCQLRIYIIPTQLSIVNLHVLPTDLLTYLLIVYKVKFFTFVKPINNSTAKQPILFLLERR